MPLMRWDPFTALARLDDEFDATMHRAFGTSTSQYVPPVEMIIDNTDVVISLEVPGVDIDDLAIEVADDKLIISGERKEKWSDDNGRVMVRELRYGSFKRTFQLPEGITADDIEAEADKGLLKVIVRNVVKPDPPPKRIAISPRGSKKHKMVETKT